jgi:hypothetical protein
MKPSQRPLHDPSIDAQPAAGVGIASGEDRSTAPLAKLSSVGIGIVATIALDTFGTTPGTPSLSSYRGNRVHHILLKHNLQQDCPTKGIKTKKARKWLAELPLGEIDRLEMNQLLARWDLWDSQIVAIDKKIEERQSKHKTAPVVATIPGANAYSSLALASRGLARLIDSPVRAAWPIIGA